MWMPLDCDLRGRCELLRVGREAFILFHSFIVLVVILCLCRNGADGLLIIAEAQVQATHSTTSGGANLLEQAHILLTSTT